MLRQEWILLENQVRTSTTIFKAPDTLKLLKVNIQIPHNLDFPLLKAKELHWLMKEARFPFPSSHGFLQYLWIKQKKRHLKLNTQDFKTQWSCREMKVNSQVQTTSNPIQKFVQAIKPCTTTDLITKRPIRTSMILSHAKWTSRWCCLSTSSSGDKTC